MVKAGDMPRGVPIGLGLGRADGKRISCNRLPRMWRECGEKCGAPISCSRSHCRLTALVFEVTRRGTDVGKFEGW